MLRVPALIGFALMACFSVSGDASEWNPPFSETAAGAQAVYNTAEEIAKMSPCTATVERKLPCAVLLKSPDGTTFWIGSPAASADVARFLRTLRAGQAYRFPEEFLKFQQRE